MTMEHLGVRFDYGYNGVYWLVREACSGNAAQPFENRFSNVPGGNESGFSNEAAAVPGWEITVPAYVYEWDYDPCGNRTAKRCVSGQPVFGQSTYAYGPDNRLLYEDTEVGRIEYGYDGNGNTTSKRKVWNNEIENYGYDYSNRMNTYTNPGGDTWTYIFAPTGERLAKINPPSDGTEEWYAYDGPDVIVDYTRSGSGQQPVWQSSYVQGTGIDSKIARLTTDQSNNPTTYYYVGDALNSVHRIVDGSQATVNTTITNAWGEEIVSSQSVTERHAYTQRERSPESELCYFRARVYCSEIGRFTSKDLLRSTDGESAYMYASLNPSRLTDPTGLFEKDWRTLLDSLEAMDMPVKAMRDLSASTHVGWQTGGAHRAAYILWSGNMTLDKATYGMQWVETVPGVFGGDVEDTRIKPLRDLMSQGGGTVALIYHEFWHAYFDKVFKNSDEGKIFKQNALDLFTDMPMEKRVEVADECVGNCVEALLTEVFERYREDRQDAIANITAKQAGQKLTPRIREEVGDPRAKKTEAYESVLVGKHGYYQENEIKQVKTDIRIPDYFKRIALSTWLGGYIPERYEGFLTKKWKFWYEPPGESK